jgi:hypothetical protein
VATSPILGSNAGVTNNAAHLAAKETSEKLSAHHDPADALKELAEATAPVFGSSAGSTTAHAHQEIKAIDQTPAQPLKELADATAPFGTSNSNSTAAADKVRESSTNFGSNCRASRRSGRDRQPLWNVRPRCSRCCRYRTRLGCQRGRTQRDWFGSLAR